MNIFQINISWRKIEKWQLRISVLLFFQKASNFRNFQQNMKELLLRFYNDWLFYGDVVLCCEVETLFQTFITFMNWLYQFFSAINLFCFHSYIPDLIGRGKGSLFFTPSPSEQNLKFWPSIWHCPNPPHDPTPGEYIIPLNRQWWISNDFKTWPFSIKSLISVEGNSSSFKEWFGSFFSRKPSSPNE